MVLKLLVPVFGLAVSFVPTLDIILKICQVLLAFGSFLFICYQARDLYEKRRDRRSASLNPPSDGVQQHDASKS